MNVIQPFTDNVEEIQKFLSKCDQPFETSQLYSSSRNEKFTDEDLRKSKFRSIVDPKLFALVETVVSNLNENDNTETNNSYVYSLRRNDITHIKYDKGGFFKRHRDYLSTTSNLVEEFTLLLCVTPANLSKDAEGGETTIHTLGGPKSFDTTSTGNGILFRKDLEHEGMVLKKGEKHIITANIWATRKENSSQVLLVTFPMDSKADPEAKMPVSSSIMQVADCDLSYVIPVDTLSGMLVAHVEWANRQAEQEGNDPPPVIPYECRDFDYETFGLVEKIFNRSYVEESEIEKAKECLDFFGPFKAENILVDLALRFCAACGKSDGKVKECSACGLVRYCSRECQRAHWKYHKAECQKRATEREAERKAGSTAGGDKTNAIKKAKIIKESTFDKDVIVCETEARMIAVSNVAKALGEKYVPFKMLFVEGVLETGGSMGVSAVEIPMIPAALLVGDRNNIFSLRNVCVTYSVGHRSLSEIHDDYNMVKTFLASAVANLTPGTETDLFQFDCYGHRENGYGLDLMVGLEATSGDIKSAVMSCVFGEPDAMLNGGAKTVFLPGDTTKSCDEDSSGNSFFHQDENGLISFSRDEAERASDYIASIGLDQKVKACLQEKTFLLPQKTDTVEAHFCNEAVYGTLNILWVSGVIRMDATEIALRDKEENTPKAPREKFDAWPSKEAKERTRREKLDIALREFM